MRDYSSVARKITLTLFITNSIVSAGVITMDTVNAINGSELSGVVAWAGIPATIYILAGATGSLGWGILMERFGRRKGLVLGLATGALGSIVAGIAVLIGSFLVFLMGLALLGISQSALLLGRFAAAEVHPPEARGRAIANVVLGGTVGSILGPLMVGPVGRLVLSFGAPELSGPYGIGVTVYILAMLIVYLWLRPDPTDIAHEMAMRIEGNTPVYKKLGSIFEIMRQPLILIATTSMVIGQMVMVIMMVVVSLYMKNHDHSLTDISVVVFSHTFGMFAFSIVSGRLVDRLGREPVILLGSTTLAIASLAARYSPDVLPLAGSMFLIGLGWNFCYVSGSSLLADQVPAQDQTRIQGFSDLLVGLASGVGSLVSGFVFAFAGFRTMGIMGAIIAVIPFIMIGWKNRSLSGAIFGKTTHGS